MIIAPEPDALSFRTLFTKFPYVPLVFVRWAQASEALGSMNDRRAAEILQSVDPEKAAAILVDMETATAAKILGSMKAEAAALALSTMDSTKVCCPGKVFYQGDIYYDLGIL